MTAAELLTELSRWRAAGWLRPLDLALPRLLARELGLAATAPLLLCAALLAQREGHGHTCLELAELLRLPDAVPGPADEPWLDGPAAAQLALVEVLRQLPHSLADLRSDLLASSAVGTGPGVSPLVLDGPAAAPRLYLRRHWRDEQAVAAQVLDRVAPAAPGDAADAAFTLPDPAEVRRWLDRLFVPRPDGALDWQRLACAVALRGRLALITGGPGTGKTYTVARLLALLFAVDPNRQRLRIALAAPTGKAAARLKQSIDKALDALSAALPDALDWPLLRERLSTALTLHKLLGARPDTRHLARNAAHPLEVDVLVVDEASMVHLEMMAALLDALPARARLLLLGDKDQLASVEAGAVLGDLCVYAAQGHYDAATAAWARDCTGADLPADKRQPADLGNGPGTAPPLAQQTVMLRESRRFKGAIGTLAAAVNAGQPDAALAVLRAGGGAEPGDQGTLGWLQPSHPAAVVDLALKGRPGPGDHPAAHGGYLAYLALMRRGPLAGHATAWVRDVLRAYERSRLLCAVREGDWGVAGLNQAIEARLRQHGHIARSGEWYAGRPVIVTRNDAALGVFNGDVGVTLKTADGVPRVWFLDGDTPRSVLASRLAHVDTCFAMTVHKSQGSEFEHTLLVLPPRSNPVLTRELVYTGITRASLVFTLVAPDAGVLVGAIQRRVRRASGLPGLLG